MWMFYICLVQWHSQVTGIGGRGTCCMLAHGALAGHVQGQACPLLCHWFQGRIQGWALGVHAPPFVTEQALNAEVYGALSALS